MGGGLSFLTSRGNNHPTIPVETEENRLSQSTEGLNSVQDTSVRPPRVQIMVPTTPIRPFVDLPPLPSITIPITPQRELEFLDSIPKTPCGEETHVYKYYCPICMNYYKEILRMECCGNYTCFTCCKEYLSARGLETESVQDIISSHPFLKEIECPHCCSRGFKARRVLQQEEVKDYQSSLTRLSSILTLDESTIQFDDRKTSNLETDSLSPLPPNHRGGGGGGGNIDLRLASPLKIGDSFEDLKRKMIPFKSRPSHPMTTLTLDPLLPSSSSSTSSTSQHQHLEQQLTLLNQQLLSETDQIHSSSDSIQHQQLVEQPILQSSSSFHVSSTNSSSFLHHQQQQHQIIITQTVDEFCQQLFSGTSLSSSSSSTSLVTSSTLPFNFDIAHPYLNILLPANSDSDTISLPLIPIQDRSESFLPPSLPVERTLLFDSPRPLSPSQTV